MKLQELRLQNFRNIEFGKVFFHGKNSYFYGNNAQGKTNLLESASLITALRSFRTQDLKVTIQSGKTEAQIFYNFEHEREGNVEILLRIGPSKKHIEINGTQVKKFSEILGRFPTVILSSDDLQLLRLNPPLRRRFLDLTLSVTNPDYLKSLKNYHKALGERNALLRQAVKTSAVLGIFDKILTTEAFKIFTIRKQIIQTLGKYFQEYYAKIDSGTDRPALIYKPDIILENELTLAKNLRDNQQRDFLRKSTQRGIHRDDLEFFIDTKQAKSYGSEGQQRSLVLALRLAQWHHFREISKIQPIIMIDDVLGQLDPYRSQSFWRAIEPNTQVIATGTTLQSALSANEWNHYRVEGGTYVLENTSDCVLQN